MRITLRTLRSRQAPSHGLRQTAERAPQSDSATESVACGGNHASAVRRCPSPFARVRALLLPLSQLFFLGDVLIQVHLNDHEAKKKEERFVPRHLASV